MQLRLLLFILCFQLFCCGQLMAQFQGGADDGNAISLLPARTLGNSIYTGGSDDGFAFSLLAARPLGNSIFTGGNDDGFSLSLLTNQSLGNNIFKGGNDDGFSSSLLSTQSLGSNIFKGGTDDGIAMSLSAASPLGNSFFKGGADDGWAMALGQNLQLVPVTLLNFNAAWQAANVRCGWQTSMEINVHHFEVERSIDGNNFSYAGKVAASGNSSIIQTYSFTDIAVNSQYSSPPPVIFYRLKTVDNDGQIQYSAIVALENKTGSAILYALYPNPANQQLTIETKGNFKKYSFRLINQQGQVLLQKNVTAAKELLHTSNYPAGSYTVQITAADNGSTQSFKILIVH